MDIKEVLLDAADQEFTQDGQVFRLTVCREAANEIERLEKKNKLLQKELKKHLTYQEHRYGRIGTHDPICYEYGPRHYECALREIERLRGEVDELRDALRWAAPYVKDDPRVSAIIKATLKEEK